MLRSTDSKLETRSLTDIDKAETAEQFVSEYFVGLNRTADLDTAELKSLIGDLDAWVTNAIGDYESAISESVRLKSSTPTKLAALAFVILKKIGIL